MVHIFDANLSRDSKKDFPNDSLVVQVKPVLKQTKRCSLDVSGETSIDNQLEIDNSKVEAHLEINYNP